MPMGKGTYGSQVGRPPKKKGLIKKGKKITMSQYRKILKSRTK